MRVENGAHRSAVGSGTFSRNSKGYSRVTMVEEGNTSADEMQKKQSENGGLDDCMPNYEDNNPFNSLVKSTHPLLPFVVLFVLKLLFDARIELFLCVALFITCFKVDSLLLEITGLRKNTERSIRAAQLLGFLLLNVFLLLIVYADKKILRIFAFMKPEITLDLFHVIFYVALVDFIIKMATMMVKCGVYLVPSRVFPSSFEDKGWVYLTIELLSQLYRTIVPPGLWIHLFLQMDGTSQYIFNIVLIIIAVAFKLFQLHSLGKSVLEQLRSFGKETFQAMPVEPSTTTCPICQGPFSNPVITGSCMHIFCNKCLASWCNRDKKCPICKQELVLIESVEYRDGHTGQYFQLF